jgi:hypothetical protein
MVGYRMFGPYTFGMAGAARPTTTGLLERGAELAHLEGAIAALGGDRGRAGHPGTCRDRQGAPWSGCWVSTPPGRECRR